MQPQQVQSQKPQQGWSQQLTNYYIDSHTHLLDYDRQSHLSFQQIFDQSQSNNIKYIAANSCCTGQFSHMKLLTKHSSASLTIIPCYGIHPCYICQELKFQTNNWRQLLRQYLLGDPFSQVGEIGLDFRKDVIQTNPQDKQWEYFEYQFQLAYELNRSTTIHCVRAYGELLKYLKKWNTKLTVNSSTKGSNNKQNQTPTNNNLPNDKKTLTIILHSYGGSKQITKSILKLTNLNIYFSLSLKHSQDILSIIPIQQLLLQTDAPYQNEHKIILEHNLRTQQQIDEDNKQYQHFMNIKTEKPELLKECKFFNKSILDNRPVNVIANYRQISKHYHLDLVQFVALVGQNALKAFKILK